MTEAIVDCVLDLRVELGECPVWCERNVVSFPGRPKLTQAVEGITRFAPTRQPYRVSDKDRLNVVIEEGLWGKPSEPRSRMTQRIFLTFSVSSSTADPIYQGQLSRKVHLPLPTRRR
jgi:hypothetical protein